MRALKRRMQTKDEGGLVGPTETLTVIRSLGAEGQTWYTLSNAPRQEPLPRLVAAHGERTRVETVLHEGKGEVGLGQYEVRSWVGWHHHRTLGLLALWFLTVERRRLGKKTPALTAPQVRQIFSALLRTPAPTPAQIAAEVTRVLRRNEESRIYAWYQQTQTFPPPRPVAKGAAGAPRRKRLQ